jgi:xanthine dehydrogenase iron-sulfur cluster and FAD-binding subunit A
VGIRLDGQGTEPRDGAIQLDLAHDEVDEALLGGGTEALPRRAELGDANLTAREWVKDAEARHSASSSMPT